MNNLTIVNLSTFSIPSFPFPAWPAISMSLLWRLFSSSRLYSFTSSLPFSTSAGTVNFITSDSSYKVILESIWCYNLNFFRSVHTGMVVAVVYFAILPKTTLSSLCETREKRKVSTVFVPENMLNNYLSRRQKMQHFLISINVRVCHSYYFKAFWHKFQTNSHIVVEVIFV